MSSVFEINKKIGRGINLGNALEAPHEGNWGLRIDTKYFKIIKEAGFSSVRIPIKWSAHSENTSPFTIHPKFFNRIDEVIKQALTSELIVIINIHHFTELFRSPHKYKNLFFVLWEQISERYKNYSDHLLFELLNEPSFRLTANKWNYFLAEVIPIIRKSNNERVILIGPSKWNNIEGLNKFKLPNQRENIIVTFHYYKPLRFTHQGAEWIWFSNMFLRTKWRNSKKQREKIDKHFKYVYNWSLKNQIPINLGEFGAYHKADLHSRKLWTNHIVRTAEKYNFSWIYWEFGAGFGVFDINTMEWNNQLLDQLIPSE